MGRIDELAENCHSLVLFFRSNILELRRCEEGLYRLEFVIQSTNNDRHGLQPHPRDIIEMNSYRIFFSHGGDDTFIVKEFLKPKVESAGASVFLDDGRIEYGEDFRKTIFDELSGCDELLVLLTPSSLKRPWVLAEIGAVLVRDKRVVAIRYGPSEGDLQALGILSLLGSISLLRMENFDHYVEQLKRRVAEYCHG